MVTPGRQDVEPLVSVWQGLHPFLCQGSSAGGEAASYGNLVDAQEPGAIWVSGSQGP